MQEKQIFLQPDSDIADVVDKVKKTDKPIVVLVIPESATVLQSIINLKLLKKEIDKLDKRLAIVTDSKRGQKLAKQVGISVYQKAKADEIVEAEKEKEKSSNNKKRFPLSLKKKSKKSADKDSDKNKDKGSSQKKSLPKWLKYGLAILLVAIIGTGSALAYQHLPKATVDIKLEANEETKTIQLTGEESSSLATGEFRVKPISTSIEKSSEFDATGKKEIGGRANGQITIYNYWSSDPQPLVETTRFVHSPTSKLFRTTEGVVVPGTKIVEGETVPGTTTVNIRADEIGSDYNVGSGRFNIPGLPAAKQSKIYGQSDSGLTGGYEKEILVVSQEDYDKAKAELVGQIDEELISKLDEESGDWLALDKKQEKITQESANPDVGQEAGSFKLSLKKQVKTYLYQQEGFIKAVKSEFEDSLSGQKELLTESLEDNIEVKKTSFDFENGSASLTLEVVGQTIPKLDQEIIVKNIQDKSRIEAEQYLTGFSQIKDAKIDLWPFWVKVVPKNSERIKINLIHDQQ